MQNDTKGDHHATCAVAQETERSRFRDEFRALRVKLQNREPEPERPALPSPEMLRPVLRMEARPISVAVREREAPRMSADRQPFVPRGVLVVGKVALFLLVIAGGYYGPSYYSCRQMKEKGLFYFGTTVGTCMQERLAQGSDPFEAIRKSVLPNL